MDERLPIINGPISETEAKQANAVVLAYIGDAVETLYVRSVLALSSTAKSHVLHQQACKVVNARAQARRVEHILPLLDEEELAIFKRAKNSKVHSSAKNADILEYMSATGLEAVFGYLYLTGNTERLMTLLEYDYNDIIRK